jgi:hypothetical protein
MKKVLLLTVITLICETVVNAQTEKAALKNDIARIEKQEIVLNKEKQEAKLELRKLNGKEVGSQAKQQLMIDFGTTADTNWERTTHYDEATFMKDGKTLTAFYDYDSKLVGTTTNKTFSDLPVIAQQFINENYKSYNVGDILEYDDNGLIRSGMMFFNQDFTDVDSYFVELKNDNKKIVVQVNMAGTVSYFTRLR